MMTPYLKSFGHLGGLFEFANLRYGISPVSKQIMVKNLKINAYLPDY